MESLPPKSKTEGTTEGAANQGLTKRKDRFVLAGMVLFAHLSVGLSVFSPSPLLPLVIDDYSISRTTASLLLTLALLFAAVFGLPGGVIIGRMGVRRAFTAGWCLTAFVALSAVAPNFGTLLALRLAFGIGLALLVTATGPLLMRWFRPKEILILNGFNSAALSLGIALSISTAVPLAEVVGWSGALSIFGLTALVGTVAWIMLSGPIDEPGRPVSMVSARELWAVLSNRAVILLVAADAGSLFQYTALTSWLPSFFNEMRDMSLTRAGFITGLLPFVGVFAVLAGGILPSRLDSKRVFLIVPGVLVILAGPGSFLFGSLWGIYLSIVVLGIGSWFYVPVLLSYPMEMPGMTPQKVAVVWGFLITISGFAMFLSPILVGALRDIYGGFVPGFTVAAVVAWTLLLAGILLPKISGSSDASSDHD